MTLETKLWETGKKLVNGGEGGGEIWVALNKGRGDHKVKKKRLIGGHISWDRHSLPV